MDTHLDPREQSRMDVTRWFAELDRLNDEPFMPHGRNQPATPESKPSQSIQTPSITIGDPHI